jgi:beta-lactamase class A
MSDAAFRLVYFAPDLNSAIPGDLRDASTPTAMAKNLRYLIY